MQYWVIEIDLCLFKNWLNQRWSNEKRKRMLIQASYRASEFEHAPVQITRFGSISKIGRWFTVRRACLRTGGLSYSGITINTGWALPRYTEILWFTLRGGVFSFLLDRRAHLYNWVSVATGSSLERFLNLPSKTSPFCKSFRKERNIGNAYWLTGLTYLGTMSVWFEKLWNSTDCKNLREYQTRQVACLSPRNITWLRINTTALAKIKLKIFTTSLLKTKFPKSTHSSNWH